MSLETKKPNLDSVTTINADGSRYAIHPADVKGKFTIMRRVTAAILLIIYIALPWIPINGYPAVFLDIEERRFHLFGITLLTHDLWILFFLIAGLAFALFVLSSVVGRVWCGWYCPYTVFLDHVYRRVERLIEGNSLKRKQLDKSPWNKNKLIKRGSKWFSFLIISLILAHIFLSYFISLPKLWEHMQANPVDHIGEFLFILSFTLVFCFMFGYFREQFCIIMCPYGRFQSSLTDDDTITVAYDYKRGEPRGKKRRIVPELEPAPEPVGDCVDCRRCVNVCPTGIDIRNGIQLECVACSSCIDACNDIMKKLKRPQGLIRYDSVNNIESGERKILRPRTYMYGIFILLGAVAMFYTLKSKARPFYADVARLEGSNYVSNEDGVRNMFSFEIINKKNEAMSFKIEPEASEEIQFTDTGSITIPKGETKKFTMRVFTTKQGYEGAKDVKFNIISSDGSTIILKQRFTGPNQFLYKGTAGQDESLNTNK